MGTFLDAYDYSKLNPEDINHLNISIAHNEIEAAKKSLRKRKVQDLMNHPLNSTRPLQNN
jgi:hypothetical protein